MPHISGDAIVIIVLALIAYIVSFIVFVNKMNTGFEVTKAQISAQETNINTKLDGHKQQVTTQIDSLKETVSTEIKSYKEIIEAKIEDYKEYTNGEITTLAKKQDKHNCVLERMSSAEQSLLSAHHRITELKEDFRKAS